jgi:DNA-binding transcriptional regulator YdaS (Cro superfamily)
LGECKQQGLRLSLRYANFVAVTKPSRPYRRTRKSLPPIASLRLALGLSQLAFGERIGVRNKTTVSLIERGIRPATSRQALAIEELSGGTINAAELCEDVRLARAATGGAA